MLEMIYIIICLIYAGYKWKKTKSESLVYVIILFISSYIIRKLDLPIELSFTFWAFFGFAILLYKFLKKRTERYLYIFSMMFLVFGMFFLLIAIEKMGYQDKVMKFLISAVKH